MLFIFASTLFCVALFCGLGCALLRITKWQVRSNPVLVPFAGVCIACLYFSYVSLFLPLTVRTLLPLVYAGAAGIAVSLPSMKSLLCGKSQRRSVLIGVLFVIFAALYLSYTFYHDGDMVMGGDTYLYHLSIVSWMNAAKAVPGLANLHFRLGMNSAYLQLAAGLDVGYLDKYSAYIMPAVFSLLFISYCVYEIVYNKTGQKAIAIMMLLYLYLFQYWWPQLYYDVPSMMFMSLAYYEALRLWMGEEIGIDNEMLLLYATVAFCTKQMAAVMLIIVFVFIIYDMKKKWLLSRSSRIETKALSIRTAASAVVLPALFAVSYVARNVIQTGYPLYPLPIMRFGFKWATPLDVTEGCYYAIKYWARWPRAGYMAVRDNPFMFWFAPWIKDALLCDDTTCLTALFMSVLLSIAAIRTQWRKSLPPILAIVLNLVYWFAAAPGFRFGSVFFFLLLGTMIYFCGRALALGGNLAGDGGVANGARSHNAVIFAVIFIAVASILVVYVKTLQLNSSVTFHHWGVKAFDMILLQLIAYTSCVFVSFPIGKHTLKRNGVFIILCLYTANFVFGNLFRNRSDAGEIIAQFASPLPPPAASCPVHSVTLQNGQTPPLAVWVPDEGSLCADAPLPCTPYPSDKLKALVPGYPLMGFCRD